MSYVAEAANRLRPIEKENCRCMAEMVNQGHAKVEEKIQRTDSHASLCSSRSSNSSSSEGSYEPKP